MANEEYNPYFLLRTVFNTFPFTPLTPLTHHVLFRRIT